MRRLLPLFALAFLLSSCGPLVTEASYPDRKEGSDKIVYSDQKRETIWGDDTLSSKLFGNKKDDNSAGNAGIGVNSFLWRAALDTVSFMPIASADPFGGVILTDWYENVKKPGERFKIQIYILDRRLRADALRVSVFKERRTGNTWRATTVPEDMAVSIENSILTRARELRVAQMGIDRN